MTIDEIVETLNNYENLIESLWNLVLSKGTVTRV